MSDIFFSYAREDKERVRPLIEHFEKLGWSCFWDLDIPTGHRWDAKIQKELETAKAVVVLWSNDSVQSEWVIIEATKGKERRILFPALLDDVEIPLAFSLTQAANLVGWDGSESHTELNHLEEDLSNILGPPVLNTEKTAPPESRGKYESQVSDAMRARSPFRGLLFLRTLSNRTRMYIFVLMIIGTAGLGVALFSSLPSTIPNDREKKNRTGQPSGPPQKTSIVIGGKNFLESYLLVEVMGRFIERENPGLIVHRCYQLGKARALYEKLRRGEIDLYPEYTGTVLSQILHRKADEVRDEQKHSTKAINNLLEQENRDNNVEWLERLGYNSAWHLVMLRERAEEKGISKISNISPRDDKGEKLTILFSPDFFDREDLLRGLSKRYQFVLTAGTISHRFKYNKLLDGELDLTDGYGTDPELNQENSPFLILEDDKQFFSPYYYAAPFANKDTLDEIPGVRTSLQKLASQKITHDDIVTLITEGNDQELAEKPLSEDSAAQRKMKKIVEKWLSSKDPGYSPITPVYSECKR